MHVIASYTRFYFRVNRPEEEPLHVAIDCLRRCPEEVVDDFWAPGARRWKGVRRFH